VAVTDQCTADPCRDILRNLTFITDKSVNEVNIFKPAKSTNILSSEYVWYNRSFNVFSLVSVEKEVKLNGGEVI